ncbi:tRNA (N6-threonylcarbamoyladenosine(37)-N6)-methyltransferase TrmO [candidate division WOR-3 bacterium]|nr:tRNA (N6-threonylcarbamoyladenosine(37)-N6)-methyltransferase TrmO [candidate division WOR-3 bacterium]
MTANRISYTPIGVIRSPFKVAEGTPIQPAAGKGIRGTVEVFPAHARGLKDLVRFSHIILVYHFHLSTKSSLQVRPFMDDKLRGVFATRAPSRPNPIGMSVVRLIRRKRNILHIQDLDIIDGTPLLDIKPYVPEFDHRKKAMYRIGWLKKRAHHVTSTKADRRFAR